jgi:hypothetical protein
MIDPHNILDNKQVVWVSEWRQTINDEDHITENGLNA